MNRIDYCIELEALDCKVKQGILSAAIEAIPESKGKIKRKAVLWWNKCKTAVRNRNKAFKLMKRTHNCQHMIQYKQAQSVVRRTIRQAKQTYWREFW